MRTRIVRDALLALGLAAAATLVVRRIGEAISRDGDEPFDERSSHRSFEAAPLLVIRGARVVLSVARGDGAEIELAGAAVAERAADGSRLTLDVAPRSRASIAVPEGTAVRVRVARARLSIDGIDDVGVRCARARVALHDVGGRIRLRAARAAIAVDVADDRPVERVKAEVARTRLALRLPARGGDYRIDAAASRMRVPATVDGGIPVAVRAARSAVAISAG